MTATVDHVVLTRFNLPTPGPESLVRAQDGWLRNRVELFERYTVPSMRGQTVRDLTWIVYLDPDSPRWLQERLQPLVDDGVFHALHRERVDWQDVVSDARALTGGRGDILLTTNLDNDDAVARDFVERLQHEARRHVGTALYLRTGLIVQDGRLYRRDDPENAFCSVSETWARPVTAWRDWHNRLHEHLPVASVGGSPAWLQVVHGQNVSNRVRGVLVDPSTHRDEFPGLLSDAASPSATALLGDRMLRRPARAMRDGLRGMARDVLLRLWGKDGLDRLKTGIRRLRGGTRQRGSAITR